MPRKEVIVLALLAVACIAYVAVYLSQHSGVREVCFGVRCFAVEVADTREERTLGLMYRERLDADKGMLFIFEKEGVYPFWMKNTLIPLDMIWMDKDKRVVYISKDVQPCKSDPCPDYDPGRNAVYVLELNTGSADSIGLHVGSEAIFK